MKYGETFVLRFRGMLFNIRTSRICDVDEEIAFRDELEGQQAGPLTADGISGWRLQ